MTKKFNDVCISQGMIDLDELNFTKDAQAALKKIKDAPEEDKVYSLTGAKGSKCIANGNSWKDSEVKN